MVSRALGALDLVGHDDARPASPAVHLEGHTVLSYGELAGPAPVRARAVAGEGAVRYRGPGVMLGYAAGRADLCRGAQVDVLDTGDLGYLREGYLYLTGRAKRIVKVPGVRASLDDLEQMVDRPGHRAAVTCGAGDVVHLAGAGDPAVHEHQRRELAELPGVPGRHVVFRPAGQLPRTPGGKVGYQTLATVMDSRGGPVDGAEELAATLGPGT